MLEAILWRFEISRRERSSLTSCKKSVRIGTSFDLVQVFPPDLIKSRSHSRCLAVDWAGLVHAYWFSIIARNKSCSCRGFPLRTWSNLALTRNVLQWILFLSFSSRSNFFPKWTPSKQTGSSMKNVGSNLNWSSS